MDVKEGYIYTIHGNWRDRDTVSFEVIKDHGDGVLDVLMDGDERPLPKELLLEWMEKFGYEEKKAEPAKREEKKETTNKETANEEAKKDNITKIILFHILSAIVGIVGVIMFGTIVYSFGSCVYNKIKPEEPKTHIAKEQEHTKARKLTEEQKDSLNTELEKRRQWVKDNSLAIICGGDSMYHTTTLCDSLSANPFKGIQKNRDLGKYNLSTVGAAEKSKYKKCTGCTDVETAYFDFANGDLIDVLDADKYCSH